MARPTASELERARMVGAQIANRGIVAERVLEAFRRVPREAFVADALSDVAYDDTPLPIGEGQTISQPYIVAVTIAALELGGGERVLEVGTGSGYSAALLAEIAREVFTVERVPSLADAATQRLAELGYANVHVRCADGSLGWQEHAPYDAIAVAAGGPKAPSALLEQLVVGGRLVMPIGAEVRSQVLTRITRVTECDYEREPLADVRFVPLIGAQAWSERRARASPWLARLVRRC